MAEPIVRTVRLEAHAHEAFDYLADPRNRPGWQSSLRGVQMRDDGPVRVGMRWVDVTAPGLRPEMEITAFERPTRWAEAGHWHGVRADVELRFIPRADGCDVGVSLEVRLPRWWGRPGAAVARVLGLLGARAAVADLQRAGRVLTGAGTAE